MSETKAKPNEILPSARLENVLKMRQAVQDALAASRQALQDYAAAVEAEQQQLLDQANSFSALVIGEKAEAAPPIAIQPIQYSAAPVVEVVDEPDTKPAAPTKEVWSAVIFATTIVLVLALIIFGIGRAIRTLPIGTETEQMKIVNAVNSETTLSSNERFVLASQRLYQEYYAVKGTGTDEEKREQARQFALKYCPPVPDAVPGREYEQMKQELNRLRDELDALRGTGTPAPDAAKPLEDEKPKPETPQRTTPLRLFRQRADGKIEWDYNTALAIQESKR